MNFAGREQEKTWGKTINDLVYKGMNINWPIDFSDKNLGKVKKLLHDKFILGTKIFC